MTQQTAVQKSAAQSIEDMLYAAQEEIGAVLPREIGVARMLTVALELIRGDSGLQKCIQTEPGRVSIVQGVVEAAQLGLLLTKHLGHGYLVPFRSGVLSEKHKQDVHLAQFLLGYRGFIHLIRKHRDNVAHIYSRIVFPDEEFDLIEGTNRDLHHKPKHEGGEAIISKNGMLSGFLGAYSVVTFKDGTQPDFEWMPLAEIQKCRNASRAKQLETPWFTWTNEQVKKTVIRRQAKRLDLTETITMAAARDEYRELVREEPLPKLPMPRRISEIRAEVMDEKVSLEERIELMFKSFEEHKVSRAMIFEHLAVKDAKEITDEGIESLKPIYRKIVDGIAIAKAFEPDPPKPPEKKPSKQNTKPPEEHATLPTTKKPKQTEKEIIAEMIRTAKTNKDLIEISNRISDSYASEFLTQAEAKQLSESLGEHSPQ